MPLNTRYLTTNRGIIKIAQIVLGFIVCSLLCAQWYGGRSCIYEGRLGYVAGLNFVCVIINIVLLLLNFLSISAWGLERLYSIIACVLFLIASGILLWFIIDGTNNQGFLITATVLIIVEFLLFLWDVKILQGEAPN